MTYVLCACWPRDARRLDEPVIQQAAEIALTHHERWDGSGYPRGLSGEAIPLAGRIVAVADVFDALTSDRVDRRGLPVDEACRIIENGRGTHFDPKVVDAFAVCAETIAGDRASDGPYMAVHVA